MLAYMEDKYRWDAALWEIIDRDTIGNAHSCLTDLKMIHISKLMHGWLLMGHMRKHIKGLALYPVCEC